MLVLNALKFLDFIELAKLCGVRIYSKEEITYLNEGLQEDDELNIKISPSHKRIGLTSFESVVEDAEKSVVMILAY